ncbi:hypothetical protein ACFVZC_34870 [Streptomyces marokkonensis]|uniref:Uncharacterized protein n=1 Tax=Streptomyces marokkonensis TaxID=324855 RepID=A0ABW6QGZ6_9ACTN
MSPLDVVTSSAGRVLTETARHQAVGPVLSLRRPETARLLRRMRRYHVMPAFSHPWGSEQAYLELLGDVCALVVLDVPNEVKDGDVESKVRVLSKFGAVIVLTSGPTDPARLLLAGAVNVLPHDLSPRELASRLVAERRWLKLSRSGSDRRVALKARHLPELQQTSQRVLLHLLSSASRPLCCHDLCLLLGGVDAPLRRRALQARISRLDDRLAQHGMSVRSTAEWGRTTFRGIHDRRR